MDFTLIDSDNILQFVDEYTLYCYYLEFEPELKCNYLSPLRPDDENPSFGIYACKKKDVEFFWKDSGGMGDSGDIFKLIRLLYGFTANHEVIARIKSDFNLGITLPKQDKIVKNIPVQRSDIDIRIKVKNFSINNLSFWKQFNITESILKRYRVSPLSCYWLAATQKTPVFAGEHSYVYRVYSKYQLYFPLKPKGKKFRMDLTDSHILGFEHLKYNSDTLIITKSMKDVMCLSSFGYEAISPRSENIPLPANAFEVINKLYKHVYVLFDNDMKHKGDWYPYPKIYVPLDSGSKDISDFTRDYSPRITKELLKCIIHG